jgi:hypothetical protein
MNSTSKRQKGAVLVLSAVWLVAFFTFVALALNVFFLGAMMLQQRNAAEYVALAAVKLMTSPPPNRRCQDLPSGYVGIARCITARSTTAAAVPMLGTANYSQALVRLALTPLGGTVSPCTATSQPDPQSRSDFSWIGFTQPSSGRGYMILGSYNPTTRTFSPACPDDISSTSMPTAAFVHLNLRNSGSGDLAMPLITFLGGAAGISFSSRAIAYLDGDLIVVARDPMLQ